MSVVQPRRMVETAAHLADHVIPRLPVRQWVLAVPKRLRYFLHLIIAGTTKISNIDAIIPAAPYVRREGNPAEHRHDRG